MLFRDKYAFLSNMYECPVRYMGITYRCAESAYQAEKCADPNDRAKFRKINGYEAKRLGRTIEIVPNWNDVRVVMMRNIVHAKFSQNPVLLEALKRIEGEIVEDNYWKDTFWGRCNGVGSNHLGKILMRVREEL